MPGSPNMNSINLRTILFSAMNISQPDAKDFRALSCIALEQWFSKKVWLTLQGRNQISKVARLHANFYLIGLDWRKNRVLMWFWTLCTFKWGIKNGCMLKFKNFTALQKCDLHYTKLWLTLLYLLLMLKSDIEPMYAFTFTLYKF